VIVTPSPLDLSAPTFTTIPHLTIIAIAIVIVIVIVIVPCQPANPRAKDGSTLSETAASSQVAGFVTTEVNGYYGPTSAGAAVQENER